MSGVMVMMIILIILRMVTMIIDQEWSRLESTRGCSEERGDGGQEEAAQVDGDDDAILLCLAGV